MSGAASTTRLSIFDTAYFGGTATTTVSQTAVNLPTGGTYQINSANVLSNNTLGAGVLSSSLTSLGTLSSRCFRSLISSNASSTQLSIFNNAYFGATATSSFSSTGGTYAHHAASRRLGRHRSYFLHSRRCFIRLRNRNSGRHFNPQSQIYPRS